ncbi:response regulator transcription factor [Ramlibacter sp. HM2]|uniref:Response regulator transcription factor n=2 Tax=Ramlibacter pallidus TaxID=2780087 RepID=A0ABR9S6L6_9BURK|nr:response regulator transcription factor [Ramlibacter pallidus]MBE7369171.1 response regulator transcription factor [Ramlibacter pallidus]
MHRAGDRELASVPPQGTFIAPAVRVGIADDHPITRAALRCYLDEQAGIRVVAEAASGREAIDLVRTHAIDVLLLDLDMPGQSGIDALTMIKAKAEHVGILILSGYPEHQYAVPLIRNGASGYLNKACEPGEIVAAIHRVAQGARYITAVVAELLASQVITPTPGGAHEQLSARELQVFLKLAQGCSAGEVAAELSLSAKTVSTYRARLMRKLDARSNSDLTYYALKHRLLD